MKWLSKAWKQLKYDLKFIFDRCFVCTMLGILLAALATIPFRHLIDVDIMSFISALLIMPDFVLEWFAGISIMSFTNQFLLPMAVLVLFIFLVVKLRPPEKKGK